MAGVTDSRPALAGVTVLDLATFLAAPLCATFLGEFGAEVIKVEQPGVGDDLRRLGASAGGSGSSYWWFVEARNKKSITCNLRDLEGQALIRRLVASTAVVTENFRPGTLERWNLGWAELSRVRPALVMVRISAFGQTGPHRERPGFGRIAAAVGGLSYVSGYPDRPPVTPGTPPVPDSLAGAFGALGALVAPRPAERPGQGQVVDLGLYEPVLRILDDVIAVHGDHVVEDAEDRLVEPEVHHLPLAGPLRGSGRHQRAQRAEGAREGVGDGGRPRRDGRPIGIARDVREAADGGSDPPEPRALAMGARLAERRDPHHDERRPHAGELGPAEVPALERARAEVLRHDGGRRDEPADQRLPLGIAQVTRDGPLVARLDEPPVRAAGSTGGRAEAAEVVADAGLLDLDDVGAELAEERRADRRGEKRREVQHGDAVEGRRGVGHAGHLTPAVLGSSRPARGDGE